MTLFKAGLVAFSAALLFGCAQLPMNEPKQEKAKAPEEPKYCYRTLGGYNCYAEPLPASQNNRLIGYTGPAPRANSGSGPLSP